MNIERINKLLTGTGKVAEPVTKWNNGVPLNGLCIRKHGCQSAPAIYYDDDETDEMIVARILKLDDSAWDDGILTEIFGMLKDKGRVLKAAVVCLQKKGDEDIPKRTVFNQEAYIRISMYGIFDGRHAYAPGDFVSMKVTNSVMGMIEGAGISEDELWEHAIENTALNVEEGSLMDMIGKMDGPVDNAPPVHIMVENTALNIEDGTIMDMVWKTDDPVDNMPPMYVLTNKAKRYGAAALLCADVFKKLCGKYRMQSCYILPSSAHELIIIPEDMNSPVELLAMVHMINEEHVDLEDQLTPTVYHYSLDANEVTVAAKED